LASTVKSFKDVMRLWWIGNSEGVGLAVVVLVLAAILVLFRPLGHATHLTGVITAINIQDARRRPPFNAWVDLGGGSQTIVGLPARHQCVVGSRIALEKTRFSFVGRFFGQHYTVLGPGAICGPRPSSMG